MNRTARVVLLVPILCTLVGVRLSADKKKKASDDDAMSLDASAKQKKKRGEDPITQTLPLAKEPPAAVLAETDRLSFQTSTLSSKGLLSQQTRDAMRALLRSNHGGTIVQLRAFVAGSGDARRIQEIAGEIFTAQHQALPALSVALVGALPMEGAQVSLEAIAVEKRTMNPDGVAFLSGQAADSVERSVEQLKAVAKGSHLEPADFLRVTCFVSSLEESRTAQSTMQASFSAAALNYVQMRRGPVAPAAECEGVARMHANTSPSEDQLAEVRARKVVLSGTQMGFGSQESDVKLVFERLNRALASLGVRPDRIVMSHVYLTSMGLAARVRSVQNSYYAQGARPAETILPFEGLPSIDASFGVDVVAIPDSLGPGGSDH